MSKKHIKLIAVLLVLCMTLVACGGKKTGDNNNNNNNNNNNTGNNNTGNDNNNAGKDITDLKLGLNNFMKGIYSVDILENGFAETCKALGLKP